MVRRSGDILGIVLEGHAERSEIGEACLVSDTHHLGLNAVDLAETELVYLIRCHVCGGAGVDGVLITPLAVGQRSDRERGAAFRGVFGAQESGEGFVRGDHFGVDAVGNLLGQALLLLRGDIGRIFFCWAEKRIGIDNALTLDWELLDEKPDGHELVLHAGAKDFGGLAEDPWDLVQPGDVVLVVLHRVKGYGKR